MSFLPGYEFASGRKHIARKYRLLGSGFADAPIRLAAHLTPQSGPQTTDTLNRAYAPTDALTRPGCCREGQQLQCDLQTQLGRMSRRWQVM
jgi:hypothetical protein